MEARCSALHSMLHSLVWDHTSYCQPNGLGASSSCLDPREPFQPSDKDYVDNLLATATLFQSIISFLEQDRTTYAARGSLYRRALASGVAEQLDVYRAAVLQIQQYLDKRPLPSLATLQSCFHELQEVLPPLHRMYCMLHESEVSAGQLLHYIHSKSKSGLPASRSSFTRLAWHCNQVLFKQLSAWMVHGMLLDNQSEFFIQYCKDASTQAIRGSQENSAPSAVSNSVSVLAAEWHNMFQVVPEALTPGISLETADSILFVGKAIRVLRQHTLADTGMDTSLQNDCMSFAEALRKVQVQPVFDQLAFERAVELIRAKVAAHLWQLVVIQAGLPSHLEALKNYFLLAKGDFFQSFIRESHALLQLPPRPTTAEADITIPFQQSAHLSSAAEDRLFSRISICFPTHTSGSSPHESSSHTAGDASRVLHIPAYDKWDDLCLDYNVEWPLHLLLTPQVLSNYNSMFKYLLRLKRVQLELEDTWAMLRRHSSRAPDQRRLQLWQVRHHMAYMVSNLQIYIQVDVIEAQSALLAQKVANAKDFKEVEVAHHSFMEALIKQSFLDMKQIIGMLESVFSLCHRLCNTVLNDFGEPGKQHDKVGSIAADFKRRASMLYTLLQSNKLQSSQRAPFLRQFLLRLNFNGFMEREAVSNLRYPVA